MGIARCAVGWPIASDYSDAVQNPRLAFKDPELCAGRPKLDRLGLPWPISGMFASVYQFECPPRRWAVRCFLREFADQQRRYHAISQHLKTSKLPQCVDFEYQREGIRINGAWYPILKMEWIDGVPLNSSF